VPVPQASPINPEMAPCNAIVDVPIAACITVELPGSLLKLIYNEGLSARHRRLLKSLCRVMLLTVLKQAATVVKRAEFPYCLSSGVGSFVRGTEEWV
jgi:hypothetical protein